MGSCPLLNSIAAMLSGCMEQHVGCPEKIQTKKKDWHTGLFDCHSCLAGSRLCVLRKAALEVQALHTSTAAGKVKWLLMMLLDNMSEPLRLCTI